MAATNQRLEVTLKTLMESVDLSENIIERVTAAAGFPEEEVHKMVMAVREGVINAYNYGNQRDRSKKIVLAIEFEPDKLVIHVIDEGTGFEVNEVPDCLAEENLLRTSGRGIFLMKAFMDELSVQCQPGGGADLIMSKKLPQRVNGNGSSQAR